MNLLHKLARTALAAALAATLVPAAALADDVIDLQYEATTNNLYIADEASGWGFYFDTDALGNATITASNEVEGATSLTLPTTVTVGSCTYTITEIADAKLKTALFYTVKTTLEEVTFPQGLVHLGSFTCYGCTELKAVTIPASVWSIGDSAIRACTSLASVTFEADYMGYLGGYAFRGCTALTEITLPALLRTGTGTDTATLGMGASCFEGCTALVTATFKAGNVNGCSTYNNSTASGSTVFGECDSLTTFIYYCYAGSFPRKAGYMQKETTVDTAGCYYTLDFFASKAAYTAAITTVYGPDGTAYQYYDQSQALASLTYAEGTSIYAILENDAPSADEVSGTSGTQWYLADGQLNSTNPTLSETTYAYPTSRYSLTSAWVRAQSSYTYIEGDVADVSDIVVCDSNGKVLPTDAYELVFYKNVSEFQEATAPTGNDRYYDYDDETYPAPVVDGSSIAAAGQYTVLAQATSTYGYEGTQTPAVTFTVSLYDPQDCVSTYEGAATDLAAQLSRSIFGESASQVLFNVLVDASDSAALLVASALAGVGGGIVAYTEDGEASLQTKYALNATGANELIVLESVSGTIPNSTLNDIRNNVSAMANGDVSRLPFDVLDATSVSAAEMALCVYETISTYGPTFDEPYDFGSVAIVASASDSYGLAAVAQLAYSAKAAVFYTEDSGALSEEALAALEGGQFSCVYIAGPVGYVASAVQTQVEQVCSNVTRIANGASALANCQQVAEILIATYGASTQQLIITDARNLALATAAASLAAASNALCLTYGTSEQLAAINAYIEEQNLIKFSSIIYLNSTDEVAVSLSDALLTAEEKEISAGEGADEGNSQGEETNSGSSAAASKKAQTITLSKKKLKVKRGKSASIIVKGAKGTLKASASTKKIKVSVSKSTIKIKVKKGCKKGKYTIKIYAKAKGNYKQSATKTLTIQVK